MQIISSSFISNLFFYYYLPSKNLFKEMENFIKDKKGMNKSFFNFFQIKIIGN